MASDYLHNHSDFAALIRIVAVQRGIDPGLVEKDYWIMHCLFGLQQMGLTFELKGGTSLSKGFRIIDRFSEDIDIRIEPPGSAPPVFAMAFVSLPYIVLAVQPRAVDGLILANPNRMRLAAIAEAAVKLAIGMDERPYPEALLRC